MVTPVGSLTPFLDDIKDITTKTFLTSGELPPHVYVGTNDEILDCKVVPMASVADKENFSIILQKLRRMFPCVALVSESWMIRRPVSGGVPTGSLANEPDRFEVVMISLFEGPNNSLLTAKVLRADNKATLAPWEAMSSPNAMTGRFV